MGYSHSTLLAGNFFLRNHLSGVVGSGKTTFLQKLMADLIKSKEVVVSRSLAVESDKVRLVTLITN